MHSNHATPRYRSRHLALILSTLLSAVGAWPATASEPAQRLIELTALADEIAFDIRQNRQQIIDQCRASEWCGVHGLEVLEVVEGADQRLQLGSIAVPRVVEIFEHLDLEAVRSIVEFFQSPLGRKIVDLEQAARTPTVLDAVAADGEAIYVRQSDDRRALLESVDSIADATAMQRQLDQYAGRIVDWVSQRARERGETPVQPAERLMDRSGHAFFQWLSATYEPLDDEELEAYIAFLDSKGGANWLNTRQEIRRRAVKEAARPILEQLIERLGDGSPAAHRNADRRP
ncbi:MAG: DUF2059 domain-containing protein [Holophagales bacterium]|nr:DUF2059 domain-containing protein [Holophagales bacterium]